MCCAKSKDISSEKERKPPRIDRKKRESKNSQIKIDSTVICQVSKDILPDDAVFCGYKNVTIQDITFNTNNVVFRREIFHSSSLNKTFSGKIPAGFEGQFGPEIKTYIITAHHQ